LEDDAMFDVDDIRGASFALVAEGFSPQEVDTRLEELCAAVESDAGGLGETIAALEQEFAVSSPGYDPAEVRAYVAKLIAVAQNGHAPVEAPVEMPAEPPVAAVPHEAPAVEAPVEVPAVEAVAPEPEPEHVEVESTTVVVSQDLSVLGEAIQRARRTVAGLEAFVESDLATMKTACEEQWAACQAECDRALAEAQARAEKVLAAAEADAKRITKRAERDNDERRRGLDTELETLRAESARQVEEERAFAEAAMSQLRAEAAQDRADARAAMDRALEMQASIAASLEKARAELLPPRAA
jgi:cell division septum initiation protein DivIVA